MRLRYLFAYHVSIVGIEQVMFVRYLNGYRCHLLLDLRKGGGISGYEGFFFLSLGKLVGESRDGYLIIVSG